MFQDKINTVPEKQNDTSIHIQTLTATKPKRKITAMRKLLFLFVSVTLFSSCAKKDAPLITENAAPVTDSLWTEKVSKSNEEWKKILTLEQYYVMREMGTEKPFSYPLYENPDHGIYYCVACGNPLYSSDTKFDSGTGWPSFWKPYSGKSVSVSTDTSIGMTRDEISCQRCGGHLGHVFNDGPAPTGLRYCMDGVAFNFVKSN